MPTVVSPVASAATMAATNRKTGRKLLRTATPAIRCWPRMKLIPRFFMNWQGELIRSSHRAESSKRSDRGRGAGGVRGYSYPRIAEKAKILLFQDELLSSTGYLPVTMDLVVS